ncbi:adenylyl-sulfate kinase [Sediminibacterium sp.]|uniref:adenylyl-sulfate kinase n=1 Tax=Sediminibacterium sp. TaxID=1917865 RepID=UPI003F72BDCE
MIIDILLNSVKKDPTLKRHFVKAVSWRILGSIDTAILGFLITGKPSVGIKIGMLELATKIFLYFIHERLWARIPFGQLEIIKQQNKNIDIQNNIYKTTPTIQKEKREELNGHKAFTIWLTGLSGSGKSSIANLFNTWLIDNGYQSFILDGDNTRGGINRDLSFTPEGRKENTRRIAEIAKLFNESGSIVIAALISPFEKDRKAVTEIIGKDSYIEVYLNASLDTCIERDKKGLYKRAISGEIKDFTGVNSPYEIPKNSSIVLDADKKTVETLMNDLIDYLRKENKLK